jgi:hypothetical protein
MGMKRTTLVALAMGAVITFMISGCTYFLHGPSESGPIAVSSDGSGVRFAVCDSIYAASITVRVRHYPGDWHEVWESAMPSSISKHDVISGAASGNPIAPGLISGDEVSLDIKSDDQSYIYGSFVTPDGGFPPNSWVQSDGQTTSETCPTKP